MTAKAKTESKPEKKNKVKALAAMYSTLAAWGRRYEREAKRLATPAGKTA